MSETLLHGGAEPTPIMRRPARRVTRLIASPAFQAWAARMPLLRRLVRREGEAMFDLVAGFCHAQILQALVRLEVPALLQEQQLSTSALGLVCRVPHERMAVLMRGGAALGLLRERRGLWSLTTRGAALAGVPGLRGMIAHHAVLYRDLEDPVAFFRGEVETELAGFWPYVFGAAGAVDPGVTQSYSALMADSQALVAADTLAAVNLRRRVHVMDVGGGTGAFLAAVGAACPAPRLTLVDLPAVVPAAAARFAVAGLEDRVRIHPGSFRDAPLPQDADTITLVRVLYDHTDDTVTALLRAAHDALPPGGLLVVSEPMTGSTAPERAGDAYFALYCMAMRTGRARSPARIARMLEDAGFGRVRIRRARRPFVTTVVTGVRQI